MKTVLSLTLPVRLGGAHARVSSVTPKQGIKKPESGPPSVKAQAALVIRASASALVLATGALRVMVVRAAVVAAVVAAVAVMAISRKSATSNMNRTNSSVWHVICTNPRSDPCRPFRVSDVQRRLNGSGYGKGPTTKIGGG